MPTVCCHGHLPRDDAFVPTDCDPRHIRLAKFEGWLAGRLGSSLTKGNQVNEMNSGIFGRARCFARFTEPRHIETVDIGVEQGWSEEEVALGLLWRAIFHLNVLKGSAIELEDVEAKLRALISD